jgi:1,4-dihydroxy-2-naphthoate octaprenyltransferase
MNHFFFFLGLGVLAILAAINYTVGKNPYGYKGFGDLFVLVFFGLIGVCGTYYLNTHQLNWNILMPAFAIGMLSMGVLNLNNMRDIENDEKSGKKTLAVRLGSKRALAYHFLLILGALILSSIYVLLNFQSFYQFFFVITIPLFIKDLLEISKKDKPADFDPYLKKQALNTLLFSISFGAGLII